MWFRFCCNCSCTFICSFCTQYNFYSIPKSSYIILKDYCCGLWTKQKIIHALWLRAALVVMKYIYIFYLACWSHLVGEDHVDILYTRGIVDKGYIIFQLQIGSNNIITLLSKLTNVLMVCSEQVKIKLPVMWKSNDNISQRWYNLYICLFNTNILLPHKEPCDFVVNHKYLFIVSWHHLLLPPPHHHEKKLLI